MRVGCLLHHPAAIATIATIEIAVTVIVGEVVTEVATVASQKMACHLPRLRHLAAVLVDNRTQIESLDTELETETRILAGGRHLHEIRAATGLVVVAQEGQEGQAAKEDKEERPRRRIP